MILCGKNVGRGGESAVSVYGSELAAARRDWWSAIVTPGPADRETAEAAVSSLYAAARPGRPQAAVVWCDSPLALVRAAAEAGGGKDIAADVLYRPYRRELAALAGRTTKRYRLRSHLLAELQDARARRIIDAFWDSAFDTVKVAERHAWEATQGSVWDYFLYGGDIDVRETVQPEFVGSLALTQFQRDALGFVARSSAPCDLVRSCGGFILRERLALLCERHSSLGRDPEGRLHDEAAPAVAWPDGSAVYAWHGVRVPREVIMNTDSDPAAIVNEPNIEVRRLMIERIGYDRLLTALRLKPVAKDATGRLWRVELPPDEPLVLVEVENATREHDGSRRRYFLRVPPEIKTAREAVAWTFGAPSDDYLPLVET